MEVQVKDLLATVASGVDAEPEAPVRPCSRARRGASANRRPSMGWSSAVTSASEGMCRFGNHEEVHRGVRAHVVEGQELLVLVQLARRHLPRDDLAEDAVRNPGS
jgi:hypothetical protein